MHWIVDTVRHYLIAWGYWAILLGLLAEDAGVPLPGETILIFASFLAYKHNQLSMLWIIVVGVLAATSGDNIGYWIGRKGGRKLIEAHRKILRISDETLKDGERLLKKRGDVTIFFARFIWGMRMLAGPLAGALKMRWPRFLLFNFLGAVVWVSAIAGVGYAFGSQFQNLLAFFKKADIAIMAVVITVSIILWKRYKKKRKEKHKRQQEHQEADKAA